MGDGEPPVPEGLRRPRVRSQRTTREASPGRTTEPRAHNTIAHRLSQQGPGRTTRSLTGSQAQSPPALRLTAHQLSGSEPRGDHSRAQDAQHDRSPAITAEPRTHNKRAQGRSQQSPGRTTRSLTSAHSRAQGAQHDRSPALRLRAHRLSGSEPTGSQAHGSPALTGDAQQPSTGPQRPSQGAQPASQNAARTTGLYRGSLWPSHGPLSAQRTGLRGPHEARGPTGRDAQQSGLSR
jgi:hypothetical protein